MFYKQSKKEYRLTLLGINDVYAPNLGLEKTVDNNTIHKNLKKFKFLLKNHFNNIILGDNAKVTVENVYLPTILNRAVDTQILIRLCGVNDFVFDTERGLNNSPIIYTTTVDNLLLENSGTKISKSFRIPKDFLSKNYIEFEISVDSMGSTNDINVAETNFTPTLIVYEEDFEQTEDINLAPKVKY